MAQVLVVGDLGEDHTCPSLLDGEPLHNRRERALEDVVREQDAAAVAADEPLREPEGLGDAARALLVGVEETFDPVLVPVAEQPKELAGVSAARDEHQLREAGLDERLDRVRHHRPVVQRQQVLVRDARQRR